MEYKGQPNLGANGPMVDVAGLAAIQGTGGGDGMMKSKAASREGRKAAQRREWSAARNVGATGEGGQCSLGKMPQSKVAGDGAAAGNGLDDCLRRTR